MAQAHTARGSSYYFKVSAEEHRDVQNKSKEFTGASSLGSLCQGVADAALSVGGGLLSPPGLVLAYLAAKGASCGDDDDNLRSLSLTYLPFGQSVGPAETLPLPPPIYLFSISPTPGRRASRSERGPGQPPSGQTRTEGQKRSTYFCFGARLELYQWRR